jgi:hypothetical protein
LVTMSLNHREQPVRTGIALAMKKLKRAWRPKT